MTGEMGNRGYFILDRHVVVTITLEQVSDIARSHFDLPGIIGQLVKSRREDGFQLTWGVAYGVEGSLQAKQLRIDFKPGKPTQSGLD